MKSFAKLLAGCVFCWLTTAGVPGSGQTSYPMLMSLHPTAAEAGATSEHTIKSRYTMYGADRVIVTNDNPRDEDPETIAAAVTPVPSEILARPVVYNNNVVLVRTADGQILGADIKTGKISWNYSIFNTESKRL